MDLEVGCSNLSTQSVFDMSCTLNNLGVRVQTLFDAIVENNTGAIESVLDPITYDSLHSHKGCDLLSFAVFHGAEDALVVLLKWVGANNVKNMSGPAVYSAASYNRLSLLKILIEWKAPLNVGCEYGRCAIHGAVRHGHIESVKLLLDAGVDINTVTTGDSFGHTAIGLAAHLGHVDIVEILFERGAHVGEMLPQDMHVHPLLLAARNGHIDVVKLLVKLGIPITHLMFDVITTTTANHGHVEIEALLLVLRRVMISGSVDERVADACVLLQDHVRLKRMMREGKLRPLMSATFWEKERQTLNIPVCKITAKLIRDAGRVWSPVRHELHTPRVRTTVVLMMMIAHRIRADLNTNHAWINIPIPKHILYIIFGFVVSDVVPII